MQGEDWIEISGARGKRIHLRQCGGNRSLLKILQWSGGLDHREEAVCPKAVVYKGASGSTAKERLSARRKWVAAHF